MIPTYTTSVGLPKIFLAFDWLTQMKIPRTAPDINGQKPFKTLTVKRCTTQVAIRHSDHVEKYAYLWDRQTDVAGNSTESGQDDPTMIIKAKRLECADCDKDWVINKKHVTYVHAEQLKAVNKAVVHTQHEINKNTSYMLLKSVKTAHNKIKQLRLKL